jgi:glycosyltransferase involved in cell wall biosynthesis
VSRRINILYIMDHFHGTGGTERHVAYLADRLPRAHFQCRIAVLDLAPNRWVDQIRNGGVPVDHVPVTREYSPNALLPALQLSRVIRANSIDLVQTFHQKSDTFGAVVARLSGVQHIVSSKRDTGELKKPRHFFLNRRLRGLFEKVIVVADSVGEVVIAKERIPRSKIVRIYNGVDADIFAPPTHSERGFARERLGFAANELVVGMVARFRAEKSHDVFFAGALAAASEIPSLKIVAIGGGPLLDVFRARYARELHERQILMLDDVSDVTSYLHAMDIGCLLPASNEGFSNSVLEKMAVGLPLIVTDVGGNAEAVLNGQNGLVIPPRDTNAFCHALTMMLSNPVNLLKMGQRSRQLVEEKFTLQTMCAAHEELYRALVH